MSRRPIEFQLSREDQQTIRELLRAGMQPVRVVLRAIVLEQLAAGHTAPAVARIVHLSPQAVRRIAHRYRQGGVARALFERQGRGAKQLLKVADKQRIIAMVCSQPPQGQARWTMRLIAAEAVRRKLVPQVGRETIRVLLRSHELKPWREKNVVRGGARRRVSAPDGRRAGSVGKALPCERTGGVLGRKASVSAR